MGGEYMSLLKTVTDTLGHKTPQEYVAAHASSVAARRRIPACADVMVNECTTLIGAYVTGGVWRVRCHCGDAPPTHPDWGVACCIECGALHTNIEFPTNIDEIEAALLTRPIAQRYYRLGDTVEQLLAGQAETPVMPEGS